MQYLILFRQYLCYLFRKKVGDIMYEFSDKKDREKFKKTEYGKKANRLLIIFALIALPFCIFEIVMCFVDQSGIKPIILDIMSTLFVVSALIACYFDGKRDGAIEQFKIDNKSKLKK